MAYWTSETLHTRLASEQLIDPFEASSVKHCAYELKMGSQAFITSSDLKTKKELGENETLVIPSGQFALLLTEEVVTVPKSAIAFISMRFGIKQRGLINVSGFHVDPGFSGRLKFAVYNAGSKDIPVTRGDRVFMIWFANLEDETRDFYSKTSSGQNEISTDDQFLMQGKVASPAELQNQIDDLKHFFGNTKWILHVIAVTLIGVLIRLWFMETYSVPDSRDIDRLKSELAEELRIEIQREIPEAISRELSEVETGRPTPISPPPEDSN